MNENIVSEKKGDFSVKQPLRTEGIAVGVPVVFYREGKHMPGYDPVELEGTAFANTKHYAIITAVNPEDEMFFVRELASGDESGPFPFSSTAASSLERQSMCRAPTEEVRGVIDEYRQQLEGEVQKMRVFLAEAAERLQMLNNERLKLL